MGLRQPMEHDFLSLKAGSGPEDEDDVHKCGRCQAEFTSLESFVQHKIQKACQRTQEISSEQNTSAVQNEHAPSEEESVTVAHILVEASSLSEVIGHSTSDQAISPQEQVFNIEVDDSNDAVGGPEDKDVDDEASIRLKLKLLLNDDGRYVCELCQKTFKTSSILKAHLVTHGNKKEFECKSCGVAFRTKGSLIRHNRRHTDERPYTCKKCNKSFRESGALTRHLKSLTPCTEKIHYRKEGIVEVFSNGMSNSNPEVFSALRSDDIDISPMIRLVTDAKGNVLHEVHVQMQEFPVGPKSTSNEKVSNSEELLPDGGMSSESFLRQAMQTSGIVIETVRLEDLHKYKNCLSAAEEQDDGEVNLDGSEYAQAMELEVADGIMVNGFQDQACRHCDEAFTGTKDLKAHMRCHQASSRTEPPIKCEACNKEFSKWHLLKKHKDIHFTERRYKCGECGKLYKTIAHVKGHMRVHCNERPYSCAKCGKFYKTKSAQQVHFRTHTEDKPYTCQFCSRSFREKGSLVRHTRHHTGEKPYKCYKCGRGFAEHGTLNRHLRTKSGCLLSLKDTDDVVSEDNLSSDSIAETLVPEDPDTVLVEFSSVVADTQEYIIEASTDETSEATEVIEGTRQKVDSRLMKVVQQLVNHASSGHQIILQNLTLGRNGSTLDASDTITIATPESLTEQVTMTLASAIEEGTVLTTEGGVETEGGMLTLVATEDIEMLEQSGQFVLASHEGELEVQTVVI